MCWKGKGGSSRRVAAVSATRLGRIRNRHPVLRRSLLLATAAAISLGFEPAMIDRGVLARPIPRLPRPLEQLLERTGVFRGDAAAELLGNWQVALQVPVRNAEFADLMERARRDDVVVPMTHDLLAPESATVGVWHSQFFLDNYGTALLLAAPFSDDRIPVVLVHGINGSPRDFAELVPELQRAGYQPVYFFYPSGMALSEAARQLGMRLQEFLERHDVMRFAVIGHSMGGLVSKGVLNQLDVPAVLPAWRVFISISAPFGGIASAQYADRLPRRPPAWDDLAPRSPFMQKTQSTGFPSDLRFYLFFGARSGRPVMTPFGNNDGVLTVDSMVASPVTNEARDVFGFYEDHTSILVAPLVFRRLDDVLTTELGR